MITRLKAAPIKRYFLPSKSYAYPNKGWTVNAKTYEINKIYEVILPIFFSGTLNCSGSLSIKIIWVLKKPSRLVEKKDR